MKGDLVYSNRLTYPFIEYADKKLGKDATDRILESQGIDRHHIGDQNGYHTAELAVSLSKAILKALGEPDLHYRMGRDLPRSLGSVGGFLVGLTTPSICMKTLGQIEGRLARKTLNKTVLTGRNRFRVDITFRDGFREDPLICSNRIGCYEALPQFLGLPWAKVEHSQCLHKGADHCVYHVEWPEDKLIPLIRLFRILIPVSVVMGLFGLIVPGMGWSLIASLIGAAASFLCLALYRHFGAKQSLEWSLLSNEGIFQQKSLLEEANVRMTSLQELTNSLTRSNRSGEICERVASGLVEEFGFGASQIWLLDSREGVLHCPSAKGHGPKVLAELRSARLSLDVSGEGRHQLVAQVLRDRKTLVENNPSDDLLPKLGAQARAFLSSLELTALIAVPLLHEDKPVGVLVAARLDGTAITNPHRLMFLSIANIAANALVKADLFEGMERKIEQRTRELEVAGRQLVAAKEMAIQSEKLSALGQMAAGVAHEINNPLNFLVNVMPDLRRDMECLEEIRSLALGPGVDPGVADRIRELEARYDLEAHLKDKEFIFDNIRIALGKSTQIANSLKVFSRSSNKEALAFEPFAAIVQSVFDLIPQKHKGDTQVEVDIPESAGWKVNRNKMEQAVLTLVKNAIEAMDYKGRLVIRGWLKDGEAGLSFQDEGPGISPENLTKVFEPFYTTKPPGKGTGLGLTIAAEIVKRFGGILTVESVPGKGATFTMRFIPVAGLPM